MNDLRAETRAETVNRVMTGMLTSFDTHSRLFTNYHITDMEVSQWAILNDNLIRNTIINPRTMTLLIDVFGAETAYWSRTLVAINSLKQHLLTQQRQRQLQEQVVVGGFHRRTKNSKHRRYKKSRKTKSRRH
jgi:hypothetical protein